MRLYEVTILNFDTNEDENVMMNLDHISLIQDSTEGEDYQEVTLNNGEAFNVSKQTLFAAIHASESGFFKFSDKETVAEQAE